MSSSISDASNFRIILRPKVSLPHLEEEYCIEELPATVGRHSSNDIVLPYDSISRFHARIEFKDDQIKVCDLRSSNGTRLNGNQDESFTLAEGDVVSFGGVDLIFSRQNQPGEGSANGVDESRTSVHFLPENQEVVHTVIEADLPDDPSEVSGVQRSAVDPITDQMDLQHAQKRLVAFYRLQEILRSSTEEKPLLRRVLKLLFSVLAVERGVVLIRDGEDSNLFNPVAVRVQPGMEGEEGIGVSKTILMKCLQDKVAILTKDASLDERFKSSESIMANDIRSAICVPLISRHHVFGFIQLDTSSFVDPFNEDDLAFLASLGVEVALQLHNIRMLRDKIMSERMAAIGQTITGLAHNIKNVLLLTEGGSELMDTKIAAQDDAALGETWKIIKRGVERINGMVKDMLDYSRTREVKKAKCQVNDLLTEIRETFSEEIEKRGVACDLDLDPDCPGMMLDSEGLDQAIVNLLLNAIEECTEGEGRITMKTRFHEQDGCLTIHVKDNAGGIPAEVLPRIFFPFFTTKGSQGTGLGLATTKKIVEDMGGRVEVESKEGEGTTFSIAVFVDRHDLRLADPTPLDPENIVTGSESS